MGPDGANMEYACIQCADNVLRTSDVLTCADCKKWCHTRHIKFPDEHSEQEVEWVCWICDPGAYISQVGYTLILPTPPKNQSQIPEETSHRTATSERAATARCTPAEAPYRSPEARRRLSSNKSLTDYKRRCKKLQVAGGRASTPHNESYLDYMKSPTEEEGSCNDYQEILKIPERDDNGSKQKKSKHREQISIIGYDNEDMAEMMGQQINDTFLFPEDEENISSAFASSLKSCNTSTPFKDAEANDDRMKQASKTSSHLEEEHHDNFDDLEDVSMYQEFYQGLQNAVPVDIEGDRSHKSCSRPRTSRHQSIDSMQDKNEHAELNRPERLVVHSLSQGDIPNAHSAAPINIEFSRPANSSRIPASHRLHHDTYPQSAVNEVAEAGRPTDSSRRQASDRLYKEDVMQPPMVNYSDTETDKLTQSNKRLESRRLYEGKNTRVKIEADTDTNRPSSSTKRPVSRQLFKEGDVIPQQNAVSFDPNEDTETDWSSKSRLRSGTSRHRSIPRSGSSGASRNKSFMDYHRRLAKDKQRLNESYTDYLKSPAKDGHCDNYEPKETEEDAITDNFDLKETKEDTDTDDYDTKETKKYENTDDYDTKETKKDENTDDYDIKETKKAENTDDYDTKETKKAENIDDYDTKETKKDENTDDYDHKETEKDENTGDYDHKETEKDEHTDDYYHNIKSSTPKKADNDEHEPI